MSRQTVLSSVSWLGEVPKDWFVERCKYNFSHHKDIVKEKASQYERLALTMNGVIKRDKDDVEGLQPKDFEGYQIVERGDLVFKLIDLAGKSTSRVGLSSYQGLVSPAYILLHADENRITKEYATYYFLSMWHRLIFNEIGNGGIRSSLNLKDLLEVPILRPSLAEQNAIVKYLDRRDAIINEAIKTYMDTIEKLNEYKSAATIFAVTKGIHQEALMPSGEEWLGDIPSHWKIQRTRSLFKEINERGNDKLPILMVSINSGISSEEVSDEERNRIVNRSEDKSKYKRMQPGDIVYNMMRAWQGAFGAARVEGMVSPAYVTIRPIVELDSRYYEYLMRTDIAAQEFKKYSRGIRDFRLRLYYSEFRDIKVCVPPIKEQREIADYLDNLYEKIEVAIKQKLSQIEKLEEFKKSIIYSAVTGKIDCREGIK